MRIIGPDFHCDYQYRRTKVRFSTGNGTATCTAQRATDDMRQTTCSVQHARCSLHTAICTLQQAACTGQHTICSVQHATCSVQHAACSINLRAACNVQRLAGVNGSEWIDVHGTNGTTTVRLNTSLFYVLSCQHFGARLLVKLRLNAFSSGMPRCIYAGFVCLRVRVRVRRCKHARVHV